MKQIYRIAKGGILIICALSVLSSCATIMHGSTQSVGISSCPSMASVWVDSCYMGKTPLAVRMSRKHNHCVQIELEGYEPYSLQVNKHFSGWALGNIVLGGIIGLGVDALTGAIYALSPEQVCAHLSKHELASTNVGVDTYVAVVLRPDPSWQKVGSLTPKSE